MTAAWRVIDVSLSKNCNTTWPPLPRLHENNLQLRQTSLLSTCVYGHWLPAQKTLEPSYSSSSRQLRDNNSSVQTKKNPSCSLKHAYACDQALYLLGAAWVEKLTPTLASPNCNPEPHASLANISFFHLCAFHASLPGIVFMMEGKWHKIY